jgi:putative CocE/NonD family hydrolase
MRRYSVIFIMAAVAFGTAIVYAEPVAGSAGSPLESDEFVVERDVPVQMRDGVKLHADVFRPRGGGPFPVLVYRTPYGKSAAADAYDTHVDAVRRGYAVVLQDVRGRYSSDGNFDPYRREGLDGYDTIEWAAARSWSNGRVGTYGLSYPGAVQWLAAMESPPHLKAMAPAMTFSSPRNFFYSNGTFDMSWLPWIYQNVAPDRRVREGLPGIASGEEARQSWTAVAQEYLSWRPLRALPYLRREAPFYFEWLKHPPEDPWWDWAELRSRYGTVTAAVLNLSGWFDEAYGPEGAITNFNGLTAARSGDGNDRTHLILGPWTHGVHATMSRRAGELDFGPQAVIDYDDVLLDFFDRYLRYDDHHAAPTVRYFVMGENRWREDTQWPPADMVSGTRYLVAADEKLLLSPRPEPNDAASSKFVSDPDLPVVNPHPLLGPHDYQHLAERKDILTFDTEPLKASLTVAGDIAAIVYASCDCRDFDLWVRLQDVRPDGRALSLMSPGNDVQRASYRDPAAGRQLLQPGEVYEVKLSKLSTAVRFAKGHRLRVQISASFAPNFSTNLQTGLSEIDSAASRPATISIHHDPKYQSRLILPVVHR